MTNKTETTILLDIYERLGAIEANLTTMAKHEERIAKLERFEGRVGAYLWIGSSIVAGALTLLFEGIKYGIDKMMHN